MNDKGKTKSKDQIDRNAKQIRGYSSEAEARDALEKDGKTRGEDKAEDQNKKGRE